MRSRLNHSGISAIFLALLAAACGGTTVTELAGPDVVRCQASFANPPSQLPAGGGRTEVTVVSARECSWSASSEASWIQISPRSGQGEAPVTLTVAANQQPSTRSGAVIVNNERLTVSQEAAPCRYQLSASSASVGGEGGQTSVRVSAMSGCRWSASSNQPWARVETTSGDGEVTIGISVDRNPGGPRTAQLSIAGQTFTVAQAAVPPPAPAPAPVPPAPAPPPPGPGPAPAPPAPAPPSPAPSPGPVPAPPAPAPPAPPAPAPPPPVPAPPPPPPAPTPTPTPPPAACTYTLDPDSRSVRRRGDEEQFRVSTGASCAWSASSGASWIAIVSGSGTGSGQVRYRVERNDGAPRTGTISVGGQTHTVRQRGQEDDD